MIFQLFQSTFIRCTGHVQFVYKYETRNIIEIEQFDQRQGMTLDTFNAAHHKNSIIQHRKSSLHLGAEICMARCIHQSEFLFSHVKSGLFGKHRDTAVSFHRVIVQKRVLLIHPSHLSGGTGEIKDSLR